MSDSFWMSFFVFIGVVVGVWKTFKNGDIAAQTHTLVNSNMAVQLRLHATTARRLANLTNDVVDMETAHLAESLAKEHDGKAD